MDVREVADSKKLWNNELKCTKYTKLYEIRSNVSWMLYKSNCVEVSLKNKKTQKRT